MDKYSIGCIGSNLFAIIARELTYVYGLKPKCKDYSDPTLCYKILPDGTFIGQPIMNDCVVTEITFRNIWLRGRYLHKGFIGNKNVQLPLIPQNPNCLIGNSTDFVYYYDTAIFSIRYTEDCPNFDVTSKIEIISDKQFMNLFMKVPALKGGSTLESIIKDMIEKYNFTALVSGRDTTYHYTFRDNGGKWYFTTSSNGYSASIDGFKDYWSKILPRREKFCQKSEDKPTIVSETTLQLLEIQPLKIVI